MNDFKAFIERLKEAVNIEDIIADTGNLTPVRAGKYFKTKEHDSLSIDPDRGWYEWYSKGDSLGARGDVLEWLQHHGGFPDFQDAVGYLSDKTGIRYQRKPGEARRYQARRRRYDDLTQLIDFLADALWQPAGAAALDYARGRGWTDETIKAARLGVWHWDLAQDLRGHLQMHEVDLDSPAVVSLLGFKGDVRAWAAKQDVKPEKEWLDAGKIKGAPGGLLIYPHYERGRCIYFSGRKLDWTPKDKYPKSWNPKAALAGKRRPYWNHVAASKHAVIVEGQADAISLGQWGIPSVALAGASAAKSLISRLGRLKRVFIALDNDKAGNRGKEALGAALGPAAPVVTWPDGGDVNDWLQAGGSAAACKELLAAAPIHALYMAQRVQETAALEREDARRQAYILISRLDPLTYTRNAAALAEALGDSVTELNKMVKAAQKAAPARPANGRDERPVRQPPENEPQEEARRPGLITDSLTKEQEKALISFPRDQGGHADAVNHLYGHKIAFVPEWGWLISNGKFWARQGAELHVRTLVENTIKARRILAVQHDVEGLVKATSGSRANVAGALDLLRGRVQAFTEDFDQHPDHLNCDNGVIDLRTGELIPHKEAGDFRFTYCLPTPYNPQADYSDWLIYLGQVTSQGSANGSLNVNTELIDWLQEAVGYSITGYTTEDCLFYLYGPTRSGKGVFTQTLQKMLGRPLANSIDFGVLTEKQNQDSQNFALAPIKAARFISANEPGKYQRFNESTMKVLTGGDPISCAFKRKDFFTYTPQYKIWLSSNWPFNADPADAAVWGRARVIHFPNSFLGREDRNLKQHLQSAKSLEGILAWSVAGAQRWYARKDGLVTPVQVVHITKEQRESQDFIGQFLDECCTINKDADSFIPTRELYAAYKAWCAGELTPLKNRSFSLSLQGKGIESGRGYISEGDSFIPTPKRQVRGFYGLEFNDLGHHLAQSTKGKTGTD